MDNASEKKARDECMYVHNKTQRVGREEGNRNRAHEIPHIWPANSSTRLGAGKGKKNRQTLSLSASKRLDAPHQNVQAPLVHISLTTLLQQAGDVTQYPQRQSGFFLQALLQVPSHTASVLPLLRRLLGPLHHMRGDSTHARTVHAITTLRHPIFQLVQKDHPSLPFFDQDTHPLRSYLWMPLKLLCEGMVMRSKEPQASHLPCKMPQDGLGHTYSITATRSSPQLIQNDQAPWTSLGEDLFGLC